MKGFLFTTLSIILLVGTIILLSYALGTVENLWNNDPSLDPMVNAAAQFLEAEVKGESPGSLGLGEAPCTPYITLRLGGDPIDHLARPTINYACR